MSSHESYSIAESKLSSSISQDLLVEASPEPKTMKEEEIQHKTFSSRFEDDTF
jgi:hypothetical protein